MRKTITILLSLFFISAQAVKAEIGIGITGAVHFLDASGTETTTAGSVTGGAANTNSTSVDNSVTIPSIFAEYSLDSSIWGDEGNEITFGANYTFGSADVSDVTSSRTEVAEDAAGSGSSGTVTYAANATVENYVNYYVEMPLAGRAYVKLGFSQIDVLTKEDADHEGSYGDTSLDGVNYGVGIKGLYGPYQFKLSYETTDWDDLSLTSTTSNTISADLDNDELALSVAYRF